MHVPRRRLKIVQLNPSSSSVAVTTSSARLFANIPVASPVSKVLVSLVQSNQKGIGDGGLFAMSFAAG
jgi:hypothetical protein